MLPKLPLNDLSVLAGLNIGVLEHIHEVAADAERSRCRKRNSTHNAYQQELQYRHAAHRQYLTYNHRERSHGGKQQLHYAGGLFRCDGLRDGLTVREYHNEQN